jgi:hypothetical protein
MAKDPNESNCIEKQFLSVNEDIDFFFYLGRMSQP